MLADHVNNNGKFFILMVGTHAAQAWVHLDVPLGHVPGPHHHQQHHHHPRPNRNTPAQQRRRNRRAETRAAQEAVKVNEIETTQNITSEEAAKRTLVAVQVAFETEDEAVKVPPVYGLPVDLAHGDIQPSQVSSTVPATLSPSPSFATSPWSKLHLQNPRAAAVATLNPVADEFEPEPIASLTKADFLRFLNKSKASSITEAEKTSEPD